MLTDVLDGSLSAADQATFDLHLVGCTSCTNMLADAKRGAAWMEMLKSPRPEPPSTLLERIIAQTSGQADKEREAKAAIILGPTDFLRTPVPRPPNTLLGLPTLVPSPASAAIPYSPTNVLPFRTRITSGLRSFGQTMLQPRLAMTAAMAFFSIALTMNLTGVRLSQLHASDLKPSSILRSCYEAKAKVVRYSDNLRVVYELESRVRDLQRSSDDDGSTGSTSTPTNQSEPAKPNQQPVDQKDQKPGSQHPDQKPTHPNPGSSRRETPGGSIRLVESVRTQAPSSFAIQASAVLTPSVFKKERGLV
jgi:hypothetical protein